MSAGSSENGDRVDASEMHSSPVHVQVQDPETARIKQETLETGHGVAVGEHWRQRNPQDISDDAMQEDQYQLQGCAAPPRTPRFTC